MRITNRKILRDATRRVCLLFSVLFPLSFLNDLEYLRLLDIVEKREETRTPDSRQEQVEVAYFILGKNFL